MSKNQKTTPKLPTDIILPGKDCTIIYYRDVFTAVWEISKHIGCMIAFGAWPLSGSFPKYYITAMSTPSHPDIGEYHELDDYGPGCYCVAFNGDISCLVSILSHRKSDKIGDVNGCVLVLELLNPQLFNNLDKVKTLCSDWESDGPVTSRSVSTNGELYVFHPRVFEIKSMIQKIKVMVCRVEHFTELEKDIEFIKTNLTRLLDTLKKKDPIDKRLASLDRTIKNCIQDLDYGVPWSNEKPTMLGDVIDMYEKYLKSHDQNFDPELLERLKKSVDESISKRKESHDLSKKMIKWGDAIHSRFLNMISKTEKLYQFSSARELSYCRGQVSALKLAVRRIWNNIRPDDQAVFKVVSCFVLQKNVDFLMSFTPFKSLPSHAKFAKVKGNHYDGFQYVAAAA